MRKILKKLSVLISIMIIAVLTLLVVGTIAIPDRVKIYSKNDLWIYNVFEIEDSNSEYVQTLSNGESVCESKANVKLFGFIPVENITTITESRKYVNVGGNVIGIRLYTDGLLVVGVDDVVTSGGNISPGKQCGIEEGDIITEINDEKIRTTKAFSDIVAACDGHDVSVTVKRNSQLYYYSLTPVYSETEDKYRCGLWLRDSTAGIGTMTFVDPETGMFASLGHGICDSETQSLLPVGGGDILTAEITGLTAGSKGATGQLEGNFTDNIIGSLVDNNNCGVYGTYSSFFDDSSVMYPVAGITEVKEGAAYIISSVDSDGPKSYDIEIEKITYSSSDDMRNLTIKITDPDLLNKTGGIIQGMSGSPIIQNGMLAGAVTHVFLNDPTHGYGIFAETMIDTANLLKERIK